MKTAIVGAGYVGLVAAACLAKLGNEAVLVELDEDKVRLVKSKAPYLYEAGLEELLGQVEIEATTDYGRMASSDIIMICVGTPSNHDGSICLEYIAEAARRIARALKERRDYYVVAVKSTVAPATTEQVIIPILEGWGKKAGPDFGVCVTPEFLREGKAVHDFMYPDRIILGELDCKAGDMLSRLYRSFKAPLLRTDLKTAEMIKYASNVFLAVKVSYMNELGNICKHLGIDTFEVARGMGFDPRIGPSYLNAGLGFGGSCLPKDLRALIARAKQAGYEPKILEQVLSLNEGQALRLVELLKKHLPVKGSTIGLLGLAFKPETDDVKESRAITVVETLLREGAAIKAYDPRAVDNFRKLFPQLDYVDRDEVLGCDAILILTEWEEFEHLDYRGKVVIDGRRIAKAREARVYEGICW